MVRTAFTLAFHAYAFGALAYLALLAQGWKGLAWVARGLTFGGLGPPRHRAGPGALGATMGPERVRAGGERARLPPRRRLPGRRPASAGRAARRLPLPGGGGGARSEPVDGGARARPRRKPAPAAAPGAHRRRARRAGGVRRGHRGRRRLPRRRADGEGQALRSVLPEGAVARAARRPQPSAGGLGIHRAVADPAHRRVGPVPARSPRRTGAPPSWRWWWRGSPSGCVLQRAWSWAGEAGAWRCSPWPASACSSSPSCPGTGRG